MIDYSRTPEGDALAAQLVAASRNCEDRRAPARAAAVTAMLALYANRQHNSAALLPIAAALLPAPGPTDVHYPSDDHATAALAVGRWLANSYWMPAAPLAPLALGVLSAVETIVFGGMLPAETGEAAAWHAALSAGLRWSVTSASRCYLAGASMMLPRAARNEKLQFENLRLLCRAAIINGPAVPTARHIWGQMAVNDRQIARAIFSAGWRDSFLDMIEEDERNGQR